MKKLLIAAALLISTIAKADDLLLWQYTDHRQEFTKACTDNGKGLCIHDHIVENHPLIGLRRDSYTVLAMENSFGRTSVAALKTYSYELNSYVRPFVSAGLVTGYKSDETPYVWNGVAPAVYTGFDIHPASNSFGVVITIVPERFIGIGLRFDIGEVF
jgi:hypothetical protein